MLFLSGVISWLVGFCWCLVVMGRGDSVVLLW